MSHRLACRKLSRRRFAQCTTALRWKGKDGRRKFRGSKDLKATQEYPASFGRNAPGLNYLGLQHCPGKEWFVAGVSSCSFLHPTSTVVCSPITIPAYVYIYIIYIYIYTPINTLEGPILSSDSQCGAQH